MCHREVDGTSYRRKPYVDMQLLKQNNSKDIVYRYVCARWWAERAHGMNITPR